MKTMFCLGQNHHNTN